MLRQLTPLAILAILSVGCAREAEPTWESSELVQSLPDDLPFEVRAQVVEHSGTYADPELLTDESLPESTLKRGQAVYQKRCVQCHGVSGDGNGPVAQYLYPKPRDYRKGLFKFTSTSYGSRPLRADLIRTIKRGIRGTSMPAFSLLPEAEIEAVVDYVLVLTQRGEVEEQIAVMADLEEEVDAEMVAEDLVPLVVDRWEESREETIYPLTPQPAFTDENIAQGKQAFLSRGCAKCHGEDGRGMNPENLKSDLKDMWGNPTRAADLTSGMLRGGQEPFDIYRRIYGGINGTPMPGFANALSSEPDELWDLVAYVMSVSNQRRMGNSPFPGPMVPYISPTEAP